MRFDVLLYGVSGLLFLLAVPPLRASWKAHRYRAMVDLALLVVPVGLYVARTLIKSDGRMVWELLVLPRLIQALSVVGVYAATGRDGEAVLWPSP
ncbi:hypothetical protein [Massilia brevitalea]|uniref:hypothetical protein n=1 Tax=Massilia brevitalea TaxID=442526 RepID=UPI002738DF57|nr:hypothetical protein [Massilia brevitalea]